MDPISQTIALLRLRGLLQKQFGARDDWAIRFPSHDGAVFCHIVSGSCVFQMPGQTPRRFSDRDFFSHRATGLDARDLPSPGPDRLHAPKCAFRRACEDHRGWPIAPGPPSARWPFQVRRRQLRAAATPVARHRRDMLRAGDHCLADIAFACGYQSASAFSTAFTRTVGCPPSCFASQDRLDAAGITAS